MDTNSVHLNNSAPPFEDHAMPLVVESCGTYRFQNHPAMLTCRPDGRTDYQLLYIAAGKAHFYFEDQEETVSAGNMVLYRPGDPQKYLYRQEDCPEVFWVHFTGKDVEQMLTSYHFSQEQHVFYTGFSPEYGRLFLRMMQELQLCKPYYEEMLVSLLHQVFLLMARQCQDGHTANSRIQVEIERAVTNFSENYNKPISIEEYAESRHISTNWFIRNFKQYTGMTPIQYIRSVRIANAQSLLEQEIYNVSEVASIVGYDNPLYFSRIFKKQLGVSPSQYRKERLAPNDSQ